MKTTNINLWPTFITNIVKNIINKPLYNFADQDCIIPYRDIFLTGGSQHNHEHPGVGIACKIYALCCLLKCDVNRGRLIK